MAYLPYELVLAGFLNHQRRIMIRTVFGRLVFSGYDFFSAVDDAWLRITQGEVVELVLPCKGCLVGFIGGGDAERRDSYRFKYVTLLYGIGPPCSSDHWEVCEQPKKFLNNQNQNISTNSICQQFWVERWHHISLETNPSRHASKKTRGFGGGWGGQPMVFFQEMAVRLFSQMLKCGPQRMGVKCRILLLEMFKFCIFLICLSCVLKAWYLLAKVLDVVACLISFHKAYICKLWNFSRRFVN